MDIRISEIKPLMSEAWVRHQDGGGRASEARQIKPVPKGEGAGLGELNNRKKAPFAHPSNGARPDKGELENLVHDVQDYFSEVSVDLSFKLHEESGEVVVQVISGKTGEVVRQLPPEEVLELRERLKELRGVLFDGKI